MDFLLTKEQKYIQKAAREFALGEMAPVGREFDLNETVQFLYDWIEERLQFCDLYFRL